MKARWCLLAAVCLLGLGGAAYADGIMIPGGDVILEPEVPYFTIKYHHVDVEIRDQVATTHIDQVFINEADREVEATYVFPLPPGSVIRDFVVEADGKKMQAKLLKGDEAQAAYEEIVRKRRDPALLQYADNNTYRVRIFPIPPKGERRIEVTYTELLGLDNGLVQYTYPMSTEQFSTEPVKETVFVANIRSQDPIASIYCPSHNVDVHKENAHRAKVSYEENDTKPDRDVQLYYTVSQDAIGAHLMTFKEADKDGFFMLLAAPTVERKQDTVPKNVVFVIDKSGSMSGEKIVQARDALTFCVNSLNPEDQFEIITFSDTVRSFGDALATATSARVKAAREYIKGLTAEGSTDLDAAMKLALERRRAGRSNYIVMLTDGLPTSGETDLGKILKNVERWREKMAEAPTRIFIFGVGYDVDTHFLDKMSVNNGGIATYVRPSESIETKVSSFYAKISRPMLTELDLDFGDIKVYDLFPRELPDLFHGSQLVLLGRYDQGATGKTEIVLSGQTPDGSQQHKIEARFPKEKTKREDIPVLWASRKIGWLLDEIRLKGEEKELVDEIIRLGSEYGILTEYTAFLAEEEGEVSPEEAAKRAMEATAAGAGVRVGGYAISQRDNAQAMQMQVNMAAQNAFMDAEGNWQQIANIRNIGQRALIKQGEQWMDSRLRVATGEQQKPELQVKAYTEAYFQLSRSFPRLNNLLATSDKLLLLVNGHVVQVGEEGKTRLSEEDLKLLGAKTGEDVGLAPVLGDSEIAAMSSTSGLAPMAGLGFMLLCVGIVAVRRRR